MNSPQQISEYLAHEPPEDFRWEDWVPTDRAVIVFVVDRDRDQVLLIHKKRGLGSGMINGPGGKLEHDESFLQAARRETQEEVGVQIHDPQAMARLDFVFADGYSLEVVAFVAESWDGEPVETEEADPFWCNIGEIPFEQMWADDRLWLSSVLEGQLLRGRFIFRKEDMLFADIQACKEILLDHDDQ